MVEIHIVIFITNQKENAFFRYYREAKQHEGNEIVCVMFVS